MIYFKGKTHQAPRTPGGMMDSEPIKVEIGSGSCLFLRQKAQADIWHFSKDDIESGR